MAEFIKSFFSTINARMTNPLFGSFIISWCAWNWKILVIVFSSNMKSTHKIQYIDTILLANNYLVIDTLLIPVCWAVFMYFSLPIIYKTFEEKFSNKIEEYRYLNSNDKLLAAKNADSIGALTKDLENARKARYQETDKRVATEERLLAVENDYSKSIEELKAAHLTEMDNSIEKHRVYTKNIKNDHDAKIRELNKTISELREGIRSIKKGDL